MSQNHTAAQLQRIVALAQSGLAYSDNPYDIERYEELRELAAQMMAQGGPIAAANLSDAFAAQMGYATPKIDVRAALFSGDRILLVRERADGNRWTLPGGWADVGQSPSQSVLKEVQEECNLVARTTKLAAILDRQMGHGHLRAPFHIWKMFFLCDGLSGTFSPTLETSEMAYFAADALPTDLSLSRTSPMHLALMFKHHHAPQLPTTFD